MTAPIALETDEQRRTTARWLWTRLEAVHTPVYFSPEVAEAHRQLGLRGRMMGYTAARSAPMGAVGPEVVAAAFHGFAPAAVARVLPAAWELAAPAVVVDATLAAVSAVLGDALGGLDAEVARAAELTRHAAVLQPVEGRVLAAAWSGVPWPDDDVGTLWLAATRLREARGDAHVAALVLADLGGTDAHLTISGDSTALRERLGPLRGWSDAELDAAVLRLVGRGLLGEDGTLTDAGRELRDQLELTTDRAAAAPWVRLGQADTAELAELLELIAHRVAATGVLPNVVVRRLG